GPNGELVLIEYRGEDPNSPIKPLHTTKVQQLNKELDTVGFELAKKLDFLPMQHFLVYRKKR
nr:SAM-dependent methyltransferase [Sediminibacterium sp.]